MSTVAVVGGGNIGSYVAALLARMPEVHGFILVDRDVYERRNLESQDILPGELRRPKARVLARRLRRIRPDLRVEAIVGAVEDLPIGRLRAGVILACVDSRRARQSINEIAWRLGIPWIDAGVNSEHLLVRANAYLPGPDQPCLECAWSDSDYALLEQVYPCSCPAGPAPTGAPAALGALAAALQAIECRKMLRGEWDRVAVARQVTINALWHTQRVASLRRNPACRFDHRTWQIERLHCRLDLCSLRQAVGLGGRVELEHKPFARRLVCSQCGAGRTLLRLCCSLGEAARRCPECGAGMAPSGFDLLQRLDGTLPASILDRPLRSAGLRVGDIFHTGNGRYCEIACDHA